MATEELRVQLTADDDASKVIDKVASKAEGLEGEQVKVKVGADTKTAERDIAGLLSKVDKLSGDAANLLLTTNASQITREITDLVVDLDKLDASDPQVDITAANIGQLQGDLDQISAKAKEINGTPIRLDTGPSIDGMNRLRDSSDQSRSVLANLAGNAAQDLGAVGGVAGTAGVALGQLAEYATEGNISLRNLAGVAAPMLGVAAATLLVTQSLSKIKERSEFRTDQVDRFADALRDGASAAEIFADELEAIGDVKFETGFGFAIEIRDALATLGLDLGDFAGLTELSADQLGAWAKEMQAAGADAEALDSVVVASRYGREQLAGADERAAATTAALGDEQEKAARQAEMAARAEEEAGRRVEILGEAYTRSLTAVREFNDAVSSADWGQAAIEGAVAGAQRFAEAQFGLADIASQTEAAYDGLNAAIEENGFTFDLNTEKGRANQDQLQSLYSSVIPSMASAYDAADGSQEAFAAGMDKIAWDVMAGLTENTELSAEEIGELMTRMGLLPENVQTQFELLGAEDARVKLGLLQGAIDSLPPDIQRQVHMAILADDPQLALGIISAAITGTPMPPVPIEGDPAPVLGAIDGVSTGTYDPATVDVHGNIQPAESTTDTWAKQKRDTTPVTVQMSQALAAAQLLAFIAQPRTTTIYVGTSGLPQVSGAINAAAADRDSIIRVGTSGVGAASSQIDSAARDRTATITARVIETDIARYYRLNGGAP